MEEIIQIYNSRNYRQEQIQELKRLHEQQVDQENRAIFKKLQDTARQSKPFESERFEEYAKNSAVLELKRRNNNYRGYGILYNPEEDSKKEVDELTNRWKLKKEDKNFWYIDKIDMCFKFVPPEIPTSCDLKIITFSNCIEVIIKSKIGYMNNKETIWHEIYKF